MRQIFLDRNEVIGVRGNPIEKARIKELEQKYDNLVEALEGLDVYSSDGRLAPYDERNNGYLSKNEVNKILNDHKQDKPALSTNEGEINDTMSIEDVDRDKPKESECDECGGDKYVDMGDCPDGLAYVIDCPKCTNKQN